ncbi:MAG: hypothetical protein IKD72_05035 [Clostridia bacterium]|nr:hypothetical protein [Clostridia bacterium]
MAYYIGVDGGGTKTAFALFDETETMLASVTGPGSNHENLDTGFDGAAEILMEGVSALCDTAGIALQDVDFTLMGLAGIDHPYQHDALCARLRAQGLERFEIFNDGFIVVKAGASGKAAIGFNCGTGVCCNGIGADGTMLQRGGLGDFSGDCSGGENLCVAVVRMIYDELFLGLEQTKLTALVGAAYGFSAREDYLTLIERLEGPQAAQTARNLVGFFFEAAKQGDRPALAYCEKMAARGAQLIAALTRELTFDTEPIEVVLSGSINVKLENDAYLDLLREKASALSGKPLKFIKLTAMPVTGCVRWIRQDFCKEA